MGDLSPPQIPEPVTRIVCAWLTELPEERFQKGTSDGLPPTLDNALVGVTGFELIGLASAIYKLAEDDN